MGMVAVFAAAGALFITVILGVLGLIAHIYGRRRGRGSWPLYWVIAGGTFLSSLLVAVFAFWQLSSNMKGSGPPSGSDYELLVLGFVAPASGPGMGLLFGALALIKKGPAALLEKEK